MNVGTLIEAVQRNCHIADARHAREMTLCNYLLGMREYYRWEHGMPLGAVPPRAEVGRWLAEREALWDSVAEESYGALSLDEAHYDPFDVPAVNAVLARHGLIYGAGIGRYGSAHFFLGKLERNETVDGLRVVVSGCEYARDLAAIPAALQGDTVIVRQEALRQWLWEKAEAWGVRQVAGPMRRALEAWGWFDDQDAALERMARSETVAVILHERGEHAAGCALSGAWEEMLAGLGERRAELLARAVRDHLADCLLTLPELVARQAWPSLHFWFANLDGLRGLLFPRMAAAGEAWAASGDAAPVLAAASAGAAHWQRLADRLLEIYRTEGAGAGAAVAALLDDTASIAL